MPWTPKQLKLFRAAAHNKGIARKTGIKQSDAKRMMGEGMKRTKFKDGGSVSGGMSGWDKAVTSADLLGTTVVESLKGVKRLATGTSMKEDKRQFDEGMKKVQERHQKRKVGERGLARGGAVKRPRDGIAQRGKTKGTMR